MAKRALRGHFSGSVGGVSTLKRVCGGIFLGLWGRFDGKKGLWGHFSGSLGGGGGGGGGRFDGKKDLGAIFYESSYAVTWGSLVHIRRLWRRFGAHSSSVVHISVLKRLFGAHFGTKKRLFGAHFGG